MNWIDGIILIEECTSTSDIGLIWMVVSIISVIVLGFGSLFGGFALSRNTYSSIYMHIGCILSLIIAIIGNIIIEIIQNKFQEPNGEYEVVLTENVNMDDFHKYYEIVDYQSGKYIVRLNEES